VLPPGAACPGALTTLDLSDNPALQEIPSCVNVLIGLRVLRVSGCEIRAIDTEFCQLCSLVTLDLSHNDLDPQSFPTEMPFLRNLKTLELNHNTSLDTVPPVLFYIPKLKTLSAIDCGIPVDDPSTNALMSLVQRTRLLNLRLEEPTHDQPRCFVDHVVSTRPAPSEQLTIHTLHTPEDPHDVKPDDTEDSFTFDDLSIPLLPPPRLLSPLPTVFDSADLLGDDTEKAETADSTLQQRRYSYVF